MTDELAHTNSAARWVETTDHRTQVRDEGTGHPVVLIHSLGLEQRMWDDVAGRLVDAGLRTIRYDVRGHGSASAAPPATGADQLSDDLAELMTAVGVDQAAVVGISMGGVIAQRFAAREPERVTALGFIASPAAGVPAFEERAQAGASGLGDLVPGTLERWFGEGYDADDPGPHYAVGCLDELPVDHWCASWRALAGFDPSGDTLPSVPTVLVAGAEDTSTPASVMSAIDERRRGSGPFTEVPGAPHLLVMTHPDEVADVLLSGLALQDSGP